MSTEAQVKAWADKSTQELLSYVEDTSAEIVRFQHTIAELLNTIAAAAGELNRRHRIEHGVDPLKGIDTEKYK